MAQTWPLTLPTYFLAKGYSENPKSQLIKSDIDVGPAKLRRRFTTDALFINGQMRMSQSQLDDLETFYLTTLLGGTLTFDLVNPINSVSRELRFINPYIASHIGGVYYDVSFQLEVMP